MTRPATARSKAGRLPSSFLLSAPIALEVVRCSSHRVGDSWAGIRILIYMPSVVPAAVGQTLVMIRNTYGRTSGRGGPFLIWQVRETSAVKNWGVFVVWARRIGKIEFGDLDDCYCACCFPCLDMDMGLPFVERMYSIEVVVFGPNRPCLHGSWCGRHIGYRGSCHDDTRASVEVSKAPPVPSHYFPRRYLPQGPPAMAGRTCRQRHNRRQ